MLEFARKRGRGRHLQDVILGEIFQMCPSSDTGCFIRVFLRHSSCFIGVPGASWGSTLGGTFACWEIASQKTDKIGLNEWVVRIYTYIYA